MANITDLILSQVKSAAGSVEIPSNIKDTVLGGLTGAITGSLTKTAAKSGGIDQIKALLTGKEKAASSPVTALAGKIFTTDTLSKLKLGSGTNNALMALIPTVMDKLGGILKDQDGDGDVDLNDIILSLKGGSSTGSSSGLLGAATSILGGLFKKS